MTWNYFDQTSQVFKTFEVFHRASFNLLPIHYRQQQQREPSHNQYQHRLGAPYDPAEGLTGLLVYSEEQQYRAHGYGVNADPAVGGGDGKGTDDKGRKDGCNRKGIGFGDGELDHIEHQKIHGPDEEGVQDEKGLVLHLQDALHPFQQTFGEIAKFRNERVVHSFDDEQTDNSEDNHRK